MPLAVDGINALRLWDVDLQGIERVEVAAPANGSRPLVLLAPAPGTRAKRLNSILAQLPADVSVASYDPLKNETLQLRGRTWVQESAAGHDYRVTGAGFWQIHRDAPETLVGAVTGFLHEGGFLEPGAAVADLYAGAGLFTAPLADAVGETGSVLSVEGAPGTSRDARKNLHGSPQVEIVQGKVERVLRQRPRQFDALILDPPRAGAGKAVVSQLIASSPSRHCLCVLRPVVVRTRYWLLPAGRLVAGRAAGLRPVPPHAPSGDSRTADSPRLMWLGWA